jgi:hypothetical protein
VYARELGQHPPHPSGQLHDGLDGDNVYLVVAHGPVRTGFVSVTPPGAGRYALEKYLTREELPVLAEDGVFEVRLLTVEPERRSTAAAPLLMYAALRWTRIVAACHAALETLRPGPAAGPPRTVAATAAGPVG